LPRRARKPPPVAPSPAVFSIPPPRNTCATPILRSPRAAYSRSSTSYEQFQRDFFANAIDQLTRISWRAERTDLRSLDWNVTQTGGPSTEEVREYGRLLFDFSGGYKISQTYEITVSGRNILNGPISTYSNEPGRLKVRTYFGPAWTIGVRGRW
jgi:hypothetical protein